MGFLFPLIIGVALGYFFKPQLDTFVRRVVRMIDDRRGNDDRWRR
jgi:hypothetical protein